MLKNTDTSISVNKNQSSNFSPLEFLPLTYYFRQKIIEMDPRIPSQLFRISRLAAMNL